MSREIKTTPIVDGRDEQTFRERAIHRLLAGHRDLPPDRLGRWIELLGDADPRGRAMATIAVWTMMDVRDGSAKATEARERYFPGRADV